MSDRKSPHHGKRDQAHGPHENQGKRNLGVIPSPPDPRDFPITDLFAASGIGPVAAFPSTYTVPRPPTTDQDGTPMCVAYSNAYDQNVEDYRQAGTFFNFDEPKFFNQIGGGYLGAIPRDALARRLKEGYPVQNVGLRSQHRIKAYYRVPNDKNTIRTAIQAFGGVLFVSPWYHSWDHPWTSGKLPPPDYEIGWHEYFCFGWRDDLGFKCLNTWGTDWAKKGKFFLPYGFLGVVAEVWKTRDA